MPKQKLPRRGGRRGDGSQADTSTLSLSVCVMGAAMGRVALAAALGLGLPPTVLATEPVPALRPALTEPDRIEALIQAVQRSPGLQFVRNGAVHDAAAAADHLRLKWGKAGDRIKTAEHFIVSLASKSSLTGVPYQVRWPDGRSEPAEQFLRAALADIDARARAGKPR